MPPLRGGPANAARLKLMPPAWQAIASGERPVEDLTDEEVLSGQLVVNGRKTPRPQFYPQNFIDEQIRRSLDWANDEIRSGAREAIKVFKTVMNDERASYGDRMKAAMFFTDRFLGKEITRVMVTADDPVESLFRSILTREDGLNPAMFGDTAGAPVELSAEEREMLS